LVRQYNPGLLPSVYQGKLKWDQLTLYRQWQCGSITITMTWGRYDKSHTWRQPSDIARGKKLAGYGWRKHMKMICSMFWISREKSWQTS
jgi:hypothetical protein